MKLIKSIYRYFTANRNMRRLLKAVESSIKTGKAAKEVAEETNNSILIAFCDGSLRSFEIIKKDLELYLGGMDGK